MSRRKIVHVMEWAEMRGLTPELAKQVQVRAQGSGLSAWSEAFGEGTVRYGNWRRMGGAWGAGKVGGRGGDRDFAGGGAASEE